MNRAKVSEFDLACDSNNSYNNNSNNKKNNGVREKMSVITIFF